MGSWRRTELMEGAVVHDVTPYVDEGGGGEDVAENVSPTKAHG